MQFTPADRPTIRLPPRWEGHLSRKLPAELVALVQHIELNHAGWWALAIQRFVLAGLWLAPEPLDRPTLKAAIESEFGLELDAQTLDPQIDVLEEDHQIIQVDGKRLKISEEALADFEHDFERVGEEEAEVRRIVEQRFEDEGLPDPSDGLWDAFDEGLIVPLVQELGVRVYQMLTGGSGGLGEARGIEAFLARFPQGAEDAVRRAITSILDPSILLVRKYLLRRLNAYFLLEASRLPTNTLAAIAAGPEAVHEIIVFVDTNFLFSLLDLHSNPSDEAAASLRRLIERISDSVNVKLYVLPITMDETRRVVQSVMASLSGLRLPSNLAVAALGVPFSGLVQKYLEAAASQDNRLDVEDYFGPYASNLLPILREKGVELFNESTDPYRMDEEVLDDVTAQQEFQKANRDRVKPYESNLHDVVLWHFAKDKRLPSVTSPLDARYWVVTIDFAGLLSFDRHKQRLLDAALPICVHPASLIQLLQFWVPRDEALEQALVGAFRLPFLMVDFDDAAERVTIRILQKVSRYEGIEDLSTETIKEVLLSEALRQRMEEAQSSAEEDEILQQAFVQELRQVETRAEAERSSLMDELRERDEIAANLRTALEQAQTNAGENIADLKERISQEQSARTEAERRISTLEQQQADRIARESVRRSKTKVAWWAVISLVVCLLLGLLSASLIGRTGLVSPWPGVVSSAFFSAAWLLGLGRRAARESDLGDWWLTERAHQSSSLLWLAIFTVAMSVVGGFLTQALQ